MVLAVGIVNGAFAGHTVITDTQVWSDLTLGSGDILEIGPGGDLTVNGLGVIQGEAELILNGGSLTYNYSRFNMNDATITMYSGTATFNCGDEFKFGDDWGPSYLYLFGGTFFATSFELNYVREPHIIVGGGIFQVASESDNPQDWIDHGGVVEPARGYGELVVESKPEYHELRAIGGMSAFPRDGATNVAVDRVLGWTLGLNAVSYDVYLGTNFDDVNNADNSLPVGSSPYKGNTDSNSYVPSEEFELGEAYYWRVDEVNDANTNSPWKGVVWSFKAAGQAFDPHPSNGAKDVSVTELLTWSPWESAVSHDVYFGTSSNVVANADNSLPVGSSVYKGNQDANSYDPGSLELGQTYYWRVDEVGGEKTLKGDLWCFDVAGYLILEDFESYDSTTDLLNTWEEFGNAWVELSSRRSGPYIYKHYYHEGGQSMAVEYFNAPYFPDQYSEAGRTFADAQDWTVRDIKSMELFFRGETFNTPDDLYVVLEDATGNTATATYDDDPNNLTKEQWQQWRILLQQFGDGGVDLTAVKKVFVGLGSREPTEPRYSDGDLYIDDIRLYPPRCIPEFEPAGDLDGNCVVDFKDFGMMGQDWFASDYTITGVSPDANGLVLWYEFDQTEGSDVNDSSGNDYHGVARIEDNNAPTNAIWDPNGKYGGCIKFEKEEKAYCVQVPNEVFTHIANQVTISVWVNWDDPCTMPDEHNHLFSAHGGPGKEFEGILRLETGWRVGNLRFWDSQNRALYNAKVEDWLGGWNHYAFVKNVDEKYLRIYLNGLPVAEKTSEAAMNSPADMVRIGAATDEWHDEYTGLLDDFRIYNYALSQVEIVGAAFGSGGERYVPLESPANLKDDDQEVNFRDLALMINNWLTEQLWP